MYGACVELNVLDRSKPPGSGLVVRAPLAGGVELPCGCCGVPPVS